MSRKFSQKCEIPCASNTSFDINVLNSWPFTIEVGVAFKTGLKLKPRNKRTSPEFSPAVAMRVSCGSENSPDERGLGR